MIDLLTLRDLVNVRRLPGDVRVTIRHTESAFNINNVYQFIRSLKMLIKMAGLSTKNAISKFNEIILQHIANIQTVRPKYKPQLLILTLYVILQARLKMDITACNFC